MKQRIFLLLLTVSILGATSASAQMDSAAVAKRQKEIEKSEKSINAAQSKVDKKDRKMERLQKRADRKARKKEKKMGKLRKAEKKHEDLIRDTSTHSYLGPVKARPIATYKVPASNRSGFGLASAHPAQRLTNHVKV